MLNCVIIDDERQSREVLQKLIQRYFSEKIAVKGMAAGVTEGVEMIHRFNPDVVFLDIEMPDQNGFQLFDYFDHVHFEVVFITAYKQYAIKAIRFAALDYLLKPVNFIDLQETVKRLESKKQSERKHEKIEALLSNLAIGEDVSGKIALPTMDGFRLEAVKNIVYCEADENYTNIILNKSEKLTIPRTLKSIEDLLPPSYFFRIHKSYLVNINYVKTYSRSGGFQVTLENGIQLDVAVRRNEEFIQFLTKIKQQH